MTAKELEELCRKLRPVLGERIDQLWADCVVHPEQTPETVAVLRLLAKRKLGDSYSDTPILLPPPSAAKAAGEYLLGSVVYGHTDLYSFGLREDEWVQHLAIFGRSGSGKTNVAFLILKQLTEHGKPFLVFDWKRNYRDLVPTLSDADVSVYTVGRDVAPFGFNPLIPPEGTTPSIWLKKIIDILGQVYWLGEGVAFLLQKAVDACYREAKQSGTWPTLADVAAWLDAYPAKGREAQWIDSAKRALQTLCYAETGEVFNASRPPPMAALLSQNIVFELDALNDNDKTFFVETLLLWVHHYRMQQGARETFKHAIVIEEAHHVLLRSDTAKTTIMDVVLREIRELGEAIILLDQHPSLISLPALGNTYCTICLNLKHSKDVRTMASAMLLGEDEAKHLGRLPTGTGIVRLQDRHAQPFVVRFPLVRLGKGSVSDQQLTRKYGRCSAGADGIPLPGLPDNDIRQVRTTDKIREEDEQLGEEERELLRDVIDHPTSGVAERYRRLGLSVDRGGKLCRTLLERGLIDKASVATGYGRTVVLAPTPEARRLLGFEDDGERAGPRGGPEHEYWRHRIAEMLRADGYEVALEERLAEGHYADIIARRDGETIAVEVETGKSDVATNIQRCSAAGLNRVLVATTSPAACRQARRAAHSAGPLGPSATIVRAADLVREGVAAPHEKHRKL